MTSPNTVKLALLPSQTIGSTATFGPVDVKLQRMRELVVTWNITAAERDSGNETYDLYITTSDGLSSWDIAHFPQVITTGAKTFTLRILADQLPQTVASNGVATNDGPLQTDSTNAVGTLAAGSVRHGKWGDQLGYKLVVAGTVATGMTSTVLVEAR